MSIFVIAGNDQFAKERLATLLKELRGSKTQREFAKVLGTSYTALQDWEKQVRLPREKNLRVIAQLKGWTEAELLSYLSPAEAQPQGHEGLTDPMDIIMSQIQTLSPSQRQVLMEHLNRYLGKIPDDAVANMPCYLSAHQKYNLHLLLRASLKHQSPVEVMTQAGIRPDLFTDIYLRNDPNRLVSYDALEQFSGLCHRVIEWRGNQPPKIDETETYLGKTALLCHDLAQNG